MQLTATETEMGQLETEDRPASHILPSTLSPIDFQPPFLLRLGSALIDYIILLILPMAGLLSERLLGGHGFGIVTDRTLWLLACLLAGANVVLLPLIGAQSIGKMLTGIRIVKNDGSPASRWAILFRQTLGYLLTVGTAGIGFFICALNSSGRTLHDYLTGTVTVRANRRTVSL